MIVKKIVYVSFIILFFCSTGIADTVKIVSDPWMPHTGEGNGRKGYILDIAETIFTDAGHIVRYVVHPWTRAIIQTRSGEYHAIASCFKSEAPDFIYPRNEQGISYSLAYVRQSAGWQYDGVDSLRQIKLAVVKGYSYGDAIDLYIENHQHNSDRIWFLTGENALFKGFKMLDHGRVDGLIVDKFVAQFLLKKLEVTDNRIITAGETMKPEKLWIGFSPVQEKSADYAAILSDGMKNIRLDGRLKKILKSYGLNDWK